MGVVGVEADGGGTGVCCWRGSGVSAVERRVLEGAPGGGEWARVLGEAGGGEARPELEVEARRSSGGLEMIPSSLVAMWSWCLRGMREGGEVLKCVWSGARLTHPLRGIKRAVI